MKTSQIIQCLTEDGLTLSVSDDSNLKITGDQDKIDNWIETIRENKASILNELTGGALVTNEGTEKPLLGNEGFHRQSSVTTTGKYSVTVTDASTDPVLVQVSVKGLASFELTIPKAYYDGIALLEVLEKYSFEQEQAA